MNPAKEEEEQPGIGTVARAAGVPKCDHLGPPIIAVERYDLSGCIYDL